MGCVLALTLLAGCEVVRSDVPAETGAADLLSLRRASVALQDRIRRERAHVDEYQRQLGELGREETRLYRGVQDGEAVVAQFQSDLEFVLGDLDQLKAELAELDDVRALQQVELERLRNELAGAEQELLALRAAAERSTAELAAEQARLQSLRADLQASRSVLALRPERLSAIGGGLDQAVSGAGGWSPGPLAWALMLERSLRPFAGDSSGD